MRRDCTKKGYKVYSRYHDELRLRIHKLVDTVAAMTVDQQDQYVKQMDAKKNAKDVKYPVGWDEPSVKACIETDEKTGMKRGRETNAEESSPVTKKPKTVAPKAKPASIMVNKSTASSITAASVKKKSLTLSIPPPSPRPSPKPSALKPSAPKLPATKPPATKPSPKPSHKPLLIKPANKPKSSSSVSPSPPPPSSPRASPKPSTPKAASASPPVPRPLPSHRASPKEKSSLPSRPKVSTPTHSTVAAVASSAKRPISSTPPPPSPPPSPVSPRPMTGACQPVYRGGWHGRNVSSL